MFGIIRDIIDVNISGIHMFFHSYHCFCLCFPPHTIFLNAHARQLTSSVNHGGH